MTFDRENLFELFTEADNHKIKISLKPFLIF